MMSKSYFCFVINVIIFTLFAVDIYGASWSINKVDYKTKFENISSRSIAVDAQGKIHIAGGGDAIFYAYYDGDRWNSISMNTTLSSVDGVSLAVDSSGNVHIICCDYSMGIVQYVTNISGEWVTTTVESPEHRQDFDAFNNVSLALDLSGNAHICYYDWTSIVYATNASGSWVFTTIEDGIGSSNLEPSIGIDVSGNVHISYSERYSDDEIYMMSIKYATNASGKGKWVTTSIDDFGYDVLHMENTSLAIDSLGKVHISYPARVMSTFSDSYALKYATNTSGSWVITTAFDEWGGYSSLSIDSSDNAHISCNKGYITNAYGTWMNMGGAYSHTALNISSIAIDSSDNIHCIYIDDEDDNHELVYGLYNTAIMEWSNIATIFYKYEYLNTPFIITDRFGNVHIAYYYWGKVGSTLKYATNSSGFWVATVLDNFAGTDGINIPYFFIDASGNAHIYCLPDGGESLMYVTNSTGKWTSTKVYRFQAEYNYDEVCFALDTSGNSHISYYDKNDRNLKYITNTSGEWITTTIDSSLLVGKYASLALDSKDNIHISYYDETHASLKYATNESGTWVTTTVDGNVDIRNGVFIALDSKDNVHIDYCDYNNGLKYINNASGKWMTEVVDSVTTEEMEASLALDSKDNVHINYTSENTSYLKYAENTSDKWITSTIDEVYDYRNMHSLALDSKDNVHISYVSENDNLMYAIKDECPVKKIKCSEKSYVVNLYSAFRVTVTVKADEGCDLSGRIVTASINKSGKNRISVSPSEGITDANGKVEFEINYVRKKGNATATFKVKGSKAKAKLKVKVK